MATAVRQPCGTGGGDRTSLRDRVTSLLDEDEDEGLEVDNELLDVLSQVQHAYRRLLQNNNCFYTGHGIRL